MSQNKEPGQEVPSSQKQNIIIIKKIKKHHDGHHGGAWKVAYADFVTAMMAFFLLMWLISAVSSDRLQGIAQYFHPESGIRDMKGWEGETNALPYKQNLHMNATTSSLYPGTPNASDNNQDKKSLIVDSDATKLVNVMNNLAQNLDGSGEVTDMSDNVVIDRTPEGIRIQVLDSLNRAVFKPGSTDVEPYMQKFLFIIGDLIKTLPNYISIECHTSNKTDGDIKNLDQWKLSIDRANAIRGFLEKRIKKDQILKLIGRANTEPYDMTNLDSPQNARIVIILLNTSSLGKIQSAMPQ